MAATITKLRTKPDRAREAKAAELRQALLDFPGPLPTEEVKRIVHALDRHTPSRTAWSFLMISPEANAAIVEALVTTSARPKLAVRLWAKLLVHMDRTGEVLASREELAKELGATPSHISEVIRLLEDPIRVVRRERVSTPGQRGPGRVRFFVSPLAATSLPGPERAEAQAKATPLRLVP